MANYSEEGITQSMFNTCLAYDAESGHVTWIKPYHKGNLGRRAGGVDKHGYRRIGAFNRIFMEHRLVWCMHHGEWPNGFIDHINGKKSDNRIVNLRVVTNAENQSAVTSPTSRSTTGFRGVSYHIGCNRWIVQIRINGKAKHVGYFDNPKDASDAYEAAAKKWRGDSWRSAPCSSQKF